MKGDSVKKYFSFVLFVTVLVIIFAGIVAKRNEVGATPNFDLTSPEKLTSNSSTRANQAHTVDSKLEPNESIQKENHQSLQDARDVIRNDPYFKAGVSDKLFGFLEADQFAQDLQSFDSRIPKNDGRFETLDENGLVKARGYRSPQEDIELGFDEVNRLKDQVRRDELSINDLKSLDQQGDPAASFELARIAFRAGDMTAAEEYIIRAARLSGTPAPFTLAGLLYGMPTSDRATRILRASWYLAAYALGDYTVVTRLRSSLGNLSIEYQEIALEIASQILAGLDG